MDDLGDLLLRTARALRRAHAAALEPLGVSLHHARALAVIGADQPVRPSVVAGRLRVAPRSVTDVVAELEAQGFVGRTPDPRDGRATRLTLTASGTDIAARIEQAQARASDAFWARLDPEDHSTLSLILSRLDKGAPSATG